MVPGCMVYTERAACGTSHASAVVHHFGGYSEARYKKLVTHIAAHYIIQELCESRGGRLGLSVLTSLLVSVDVKIY